MTVVSRLELDHPPLASAGGAGLHAAIEALYVKLGDAIDSRYFTVAALLDTATATVEHNFKTAFGNLRYDLYYWNTGTGEITLVPVASRSDFIVAATGGFETTKLDVTNSSGGTLDLVVIVMNDPIELDELADVELTSQAEGDGLVWDATGAKWVNRPVAPSVANIGAGSTVSVQSASVFYGTLTADTVYVFTDVIAGKAITIILDTQDGHSYVASLAGVAMPEGKSNEILVGSGRIVMLNVSFPSASLAVASALPTVRYNEIGYSKVAMPVNTGGRSTVAAVQGGALYLGCNTAMVGTSENGPHYGAIALDRITAKQTAGIIGKFKGDVNAIALAGSHGYFGGNFTHYDGVARSNLAKVDLVTGELDTTFVPSAFNGAINALAVTAATETAANQGLFVGGAFTTYNANTRNRILKVNKDTAADMDGTFAAGTGFSGAVQAIVALVGTVYVGGAFATYQGNTRNNVVSLSSVTAVDNFATFASGTGFNSAVYALAFSGGYLMCGGSFTDYNGNTRNRIAALNTTTAADQHATFAASTGFNGTVRCFATDILFGTSGGLYVGGDFTTYVGNTRNRIAKLDVTTAADQNASFPTGDGFDSTVYGLAADNSGVYVAGAFSAYKTTLRTRVGLVKLDTTGNELEAFDVHSFNDSQTSGSTAFEGFLGVYALALNMRTLFVGGSFNRFRMDDGNNRLIKINLTTLEICPRFRPSRNWNYPTNAANVGFNQAANISALAADTSGLYVGGNFTSFHGELRGRLVKLDLNTGLEIKAFATGTGFNNNVNALAVDASGLYVVGNFTSYNGTTRNRIVKLNVTTAADLTATFAIGTGLNSTVNCLALDGSYLYVAGNFTTYNGNTRTRIVKLDKTTAADQNGTFAAGTGFDAAVNQLALDSGYLYAAGAFGTYNGNGVLYLAKLHATTAADQSGTFAQGTGFDDEAKTVCVVGSYLYVGGLFNDYNGNVRNSLIKLDKVTAADQNGTFDVSVGITGDVYNIVAPDSSLFVTGTFSYYRNRPAAGIVRISPTDGAVVRDSVA